ncbi:hypothetical protein I302_106097 [Kwoniella bestiolae CBS 10118]|uniref:Phosphatidylinositol glycan, class U n=1 Tax=Kwoniella bestiolae CBS 10118 TaxID=1296100 RepID=A0A1B9G304_9TREE|nr:hypothetical protein I302_05223 [Kwoniella bestiolae CBS 10118]OCF25403.1 hypothetical protein I302_05223 [Kwoniella bestiolae CBS 10118]
MERNKVWTHLQSYRGIIAVGTALRLALFLGASSLCHALERRPELSTPLTSIRSLKEGVYIHERGTNPYDGGVFYHSPIYLAALTYIISASSHFFTAITWTIADVASSIALINVWRSRSGVSNQKRECLITALYLFNPYTLLSCLARSTTSLDNAILLNAIASAANGQALPATILLSLATHTSLYPLLLLPPLVMLLEQTKKSRQKSSVYSTLITFITCFAALAGLNILMADYSWIGQTWGVIINVTDLTPNVGMWWYFFTEMFDHFRTFFLGVFQLHNLIYVAPICLRLSDDPLLAILVLVGIMGTWKSYPTLGDMALWAGLLGCFPEIVSNLRHPLFTLTVHLYTSILLPLLHSLWLLTGTGNANFFYAATMVYGLNASLAVVDVMGAGLRVKVKRDATEMFLKEDIQNDQTQEATNLEVIDKLWEGKGWSVVQFTGSLF